LWTKKRTHVQKQKFWECSLRIAKKIAESITKKKEILAFLGLLIFGFMCMSFMDYVSVPAPPPPEAEAAPEPWDLLNPAEYRTAVLESAKRGDIILEAYLSETSRGKVIDFFSAITNSREQAEQVLAQSAKFNISPALAFALIWEESFFNPRAVNRNANNSIDRGLCQLNSVSFPALQAEDFFNPEINIRYGLAHLKMCLDQAGSEVAALAMYNAGLNRVRAGGTPERTLNYINRILRYRQGMEKLFETECLRPGLAAPNPPPAALVYNQQ
jgi:hypothetical protein